MDKLGIYIYTHRDFDCPVTNPCYKILTEVPISEKPIQVYDVCSSDNIQRFRSCYSELKGFYWVWKNIKKEDLPEFVGFCHYRRYFSFLDNVPQKLHKDFIITFPPITKEVLKEQYVGAHNIKDLNLCFDIVRELHPEYVNDIEKVANDRILNVCNCFIMHRDVFSEYMEWLFSILFRYDEIKGLHDYDDVKRYVDSVSAEYKKPNQKIEYQYRIQGFLSERLFTLWLRHNYPNNVIHVDMVVMEDTNRFAEN